MAASGTGNIASFTAINNGATPLTAGIMVTPTANGCPGTAANAQIIVNPTPNAIVNPPSQVVCSNTATADIQFNGAVSGTQFNWINNTPSIGLAVSGTGNIPSFTAINNGNTPVIASIIVIPTANGCPGSAIVFSITASNQASNVVATPATQLICHNAPTVPISFSGGAPGSVYNWTNSTPSIGLPAAGTGDIASFTATNPGSTPVVATISVTPIVNGCAYNPISATIQVNPVATVDPIANQVVCINSITSAVNFTSPTPGTTFTWTNSTPSIGLPASGTGNIPAFTVLNSGVGVIVVTPVIGGCAGMPRSFLIVAL
jgi:hypothetical protein